MNKEGSEEEFNFWPSFSDLTITVLFLVILLFFVVVLQLAQSFPTAEIEKTRKDLITEMKQTLGPDSTILGKDTLVGSNHTIIFKSAFLFPEGQSNFKDEKSENFIRKIAEVIKKFVNQGKITRIVVEGHTNSNKTGYDPMGNWSLASNRAITVVKIFDSIGIRGPSTTTKGPSRLLSIAGYSEYDFVPGGTKDSTEDFEASKRIQMFIEYNVQLGK
ncbi:hypothetical protein MASR2M39_12260 [Ignavibacteriales bacterium]